MSPVAVAIDDSNKTPTIADMKSLLKDVTVSSAQEEEEEIPLLVPIPEQVRMK